MVRYKIVSQFSVWHKSLCKAPEHNSLVCTPLLPTREVGWLIPSQSGVWLWSPQNRTSTGELLREDPIWALLTKTCLGPVPTLRAAPEIRAPCTFPAELLPAHLASLWKLGKGIPSSRWMQPWAPGTWLGQQRADVSPTSLHNHSLHPPRGTTIPLHTWNSTDHGCPSQVPPPPPNSEIPWFN